MPTSPTSRPIRRALISVSDKTGIVPFARGLTAQGVALISTGNSARTIAEAGLPGSCPSMPAPRDFAPNSSRP